MHLLKICVIVVGFLAFSAENALAQSVDPVDRNFPGPYVGGHLSFGQALKAGGSSPGPAYVIGGEVGYIVKRDTWNRIELGLELGTGQLGFEEKSAGRADINADLNTYALFKAGYGYSLGGNTFGVWRIGAGLALSEYEGKAGGVVTRDDGQAVMALLGWDAVVPASESLEFVFGFHVRYLAFSWDEADSFQVNAPMIFGGIRARI